MTLVEQLRDLFHQMAWADARVWATVLAYDELRDDGELRERLYHIHLVQRAFLHVWRGEAFAFEGSESLRAERLARWGRDYHEAVDDFLAELTELELERDLALPWADHVAEKTGIPFVAPRFVETLLQVPWHSTHHRGQVCARIRQLGIEPPMTDFIAWVWTGKPPVAWPKGVR